MLNFWTVKMYENVSVQLWYSQKRASGYFWCTFGVLGARSPNAEDYARGYRHQPADVGETQGFGFQQEQLGHRIFERPNFQFLECDILVNWFTILNMRCFLDSFSRTGPFAVHWPMFVAFWNRTLIAYSSNVSNRRSLRSSLMHPPAVWQ